jgi:RHS repeat-associated protein
VDDGSVSFLHADGLIADISSQGVRLDQLTDALGSSRALADSGATLVGSAEYDAFGSVRLAGGESSIFRFSGEQRDGESGWTFLRARYYEPGTGRFASADTVSRTPRHAGVQRHAYVANNPMTWIDPTGHNYNLTRPVLPENMVPIVTTLAIGAGTLGAVLAANFQYLADIFWLLWQPGRVLWDVLDDWIRDRIEECETRLKRCQRACAAEEDDEKRIRCYIWCGAEYAECMWPVRN